MDTEPSIQKKLQAEIEELRDKFPSTQDLYREVCMLLFFRYGITPTANKLYQLVHKGSMSAPAEALVKFWADLREKSRVRLDNPDLPEDLKMAAGNLVGTLWTKAQGLAQESLATLRAESQTAVVEANTEMNQAVAARDAARQGLDEKSAALEAADVRVRELEQTLAREAATRSALESQLSNARQAATEQQSAMDAARRDFASELEKLRDALKITEDRYQAAEARALLEIDRERTATAKLQKEVDAVRASSAEAADRHRGETRSLQDEIGNQRQRVGHLEGELLAISALRDQLQADLTQERGSARDLSIRLSSAAHEAEVWQRKAVDAHRELETLRAVRQRKSRKGSKQLDLAKGSSE